MSMEDKAIFKFHFDCGRMGNLEGVFVASKKDVKELCDSGKQVYFGEVLGKHSEVYGKMNEGMFKVVSEDPSVVSVVEEHDLSSGYNPFDYL